MYDGLSAALTAAAGFKIAYMSGAAVSVATGIPDIGLTTQTELAQRVQLISGLLDIPLVEFDRTSRSTQSTRAAKLMSWNLAGAQAKARPIK